jgi:DNA-binding NarL/FixJ family response regulator
MPLDTDAQANLERYLRLPRETLGNEVASRVWAEAVLWPLDRAITYALGSEDVHAERPTEDATPRLSPREREVAILVGQGYTNREIAERLVVTERTAENHVQRLLNHLNLRSRTQVAAWAVHHGLVNPIEDGTSQAVN